MESAICRDKIEGMFLGVAIGDALGMPVEAMSLEEIRQKHGRIEEYLDPAGHKWFAGKLKAGMWTDDTQLTLVIAESLIAKGRIDIDDLAKRHVIVLKNSIGWGRSTRKAIERLRDGMHWSKSGFPEKFGEGTGNGVVMKISPIAAYIAAHHSRPIRPRLSVKELFERLEHLNCMTHRTRLAFSASIAHTQALYYCLSIAKGFSRGVFKSRVRKASVLGDKPLLDPGGFENDKFTDRILQLEKEDWTKKTPRKYRTLSDGVPAMSTIPCPSAMPSF